jgi:hypothetical protein
MKRALSLLLLVPFLTTQAWAILGGPFDGLNGRSQLALAGTYGVILSGNVLAESDDKNAPAPVNPETTGVMAMSVPGSGMATGRVLVFAQGLMYLGNAQGMVDRRTGEVSLVSSVSHYVVRAVSDGITTRTGVTIDSILSGKMNFALSLDYFSGLIELDGKASYYRAKVLQSELSLLTETSSSGSNTVSNQNNNQTQVASENANANRNSQASQDKSQVQNAVQTAASSQTADSLKSESANTSDTRELDQTARAVTTNVVTNPDGSTTSTTDSTGSTVNNTSNATNLSSAVSTDSRNSSMTKDAAETSVTAQSSTDGQASDLTKGSTVTAGTALTAGSTKGYTSTVTKTKYDVDVVEGKPIKLAFMDLKVTGVRQDTTVEQLAPIAPPSQGTDFQIEVATTTTGAGAPRTGN